MHKEEEVIGELKKNVCVSSHVLFPPYNETDAPSFCVKKDLKMC